MGEMQSTDGGTKRLGTEVLRRSDPIEAIVSVVSDSVRHCERLPVALACTRATVLGGVVGCLRVLSM